MPAAPELTIASEDQQMFNDDLLMNPKDLAFATSQFPQIVHLLNYPRLQDKFRVYETLANKARDRVRLLGASTLVFATLSLLALVTHPLRENVTVDTLRARHFPTHWVELLFELGGMVAAVIAVSGMWLGPWKRRWLESRLMTERLRQWHFQLFVRRGEQVEASCLDSIAANVFESQRDLWFDDFLKVHEGKLISQLAEVTGEQSDAQSWLHEPSTRYNVHGEVFAWVCKAFVRLRFFINTAILCTNYERRGMNPFGNSSDGLLLVNLGSYRVHSAFAL